MQGVTQAKEWDMGQDAEACIELIQLRETVMARSQLNTLSLNPPAVAKRLGCADEAGKIPIRGLDDPFV